MQLTIGWTKNYFCEKVEEVSENLQITTNMNRIKVVEGNIGQNLQTSILLGWEN